MIKDTEEYLLSVIIPVFNEHRTIKEIIDRVYRVNLNKEIIVVDDGSNDGTTGILKSLEGAYPNLKIYYHTENKGKGSAVKSGLQFIKGNIAVVQDSDLEVCPEELSYLIRPILNDEADVVSGRRIYDPQKTKVYWVSYYGNKIMNLFLRILYGSDIRDVGSCYKVFRTDVLKKFNVKSKGFSFDAEFTAKACKNKFRIKEMPISFFPRRYEDGKKITWIDGFYILWILLKYRFVN